MEDDADQAKALGELLKLSGFDVITAATDEEAFLAVAGTPRADLLITDIFAPIGKAGKVERGITLINKLRASKDAYLKQMPIISISGVRFPPTMAYSFDDPNAFGSDAHLAKPVSLDLLRKTIDELLDPSLRAKRA